MLKRCVVFGVLVVGLMSGAGVSALADGGDPCWVGNTNVHCSSNPAGTGQRSASVGTDGATVTWGTPLPAAAMCNPIGIGTTGGGRPYMVCEGGTIIFLD